MRKFIFLSLSLVTFCLPSFVCANLKIASHLLHDVRVISVENLTEVELSEIIEGQRPEVAIEFLKGTKMPISFFLKGDLFNLIDNTNILATIEVKQSFYARGQNGSLFLSSNLVDWKPFYEFITGNIAVGLSIEDGLPSIKGEALLNRRS